MVWPEVTSVMVLSNITLFPESMLPLYIFEPRYRMMLKNALESDRMFCVAMPNDPFGSDETPVKIAGLGLIRVAVGNPDGNSNLVLQGLKRVHLIELIQKAPYPRYSMKPVETGHGDSLVEEALTHRLLELVSERFTQGFGKKPTDGLETDLPGLSVSAVASLRENLIYLKENQNREQLADLVSCVMLSNPRDKQSILETEKLESRLSRLVQLLIEDVERNRNAE